MRYGRYENDCGRIDILPSLDGKISMTIYAPLDSKFSRHWKNVFATPSEADSWLIQNGYKFTNDLTGKVIPKELL